MSTGTLRFKQLLTTPFEGDGFYVIYGAFPGLLIETQTPQYIIDNILNNPNNSWAQNTLTSVPTYKSEGNKLKVELPLDYISANPNFKTIVLYVSVAGNFLPYAISEPIPENMKSKNVDILAIYFTMPFGQNIKGIASNRIALPEGINEFPLVSSEGSWATRIFYEELRDSIPLGLPTGKNGVFYDDNARVTDLRVPSASGSGGGINLGGGGSEIELTDEYKHATRNTPGGSSDSAFSQKGAQSLYGETALIEGKHWVNLESGGVDESTTVWSDQSVMWSRKNLNHLQALNVAVRKDLPAPESVADFFRRISLNIKNSEEGIYHVVKPITLGDLGNLTVELNSKKTFSFKKKEFFPNVLGNIATFVDDLDRTNIHLPSDYDVDINGSNVVSASLTLLNEDKKLQAIEGSSIMFYHGGQPKGDGHPGVVEIMWNKDNLDIVIRNITGKTGLEFSLPIYDGGFYGTLNENSIVGFLTLHIAKRFFFLSNTNSIYSWVPPRIEALTFKSTVGSGPGKEEYTPFSEKTVKDNYKTKYPVAVELVKFNNPQAAQGSSNEAYTSVFFVSDSNNTEHKAVGHVDKMKEITENYTSNPGGGSHPKPAPRPGGGGHSQPGRPGSGGGGGRSEDSKPTPQTIRRTTTWWRAFSRDDSFYGVKVYVDKDFMNSDYKIELTFTDINSVPWSGNPEYSGSKLIYSQRIYTISPTEEGGSDYQLVKSNDYPSGVFPIKLSIDPTSENFYLKRTGGLGEESHSDLETPNTPYLCMVTIRNASNNNSIWYANFYINSKLKFGEPVVTKEDRDQYQVFRTMPKKPSAVPLSDVILSPLPPSSLDTSSKEGIKRRQKKDEFSSKFKLIYGSCFEVERTNQILINDNVVGSIPSNVTDGGEFSVDEYVTPLIAPNSSIKVRINISGETLFGNSLLGQGFEGIVNVN